LNICFGLAFGDCLGLAFSETAGDGEPFSGAISLFCGSTKAKILPKKSAA